MGRRPPKADVARDDKAHAGKAGLPKARKAAEIAMENKKTAHDENESFARPRHPTAPNYDVSCGRVMVR